MQSSKTKLEPEQETHEFSRRFQSKSITNSFVSRNISSNSKCRARKRSSINKMLVFKRDLNKSSRHSSSWKDKSLLSKLAKVDFKPRYSVSGKWLQNIHQDTFSTKNSMNKKQIALVDLELKEILRKGAIKRAQPVQGEFLSNLFLVRKKNGGYRPVINLKMLNQFIPFLHFKMESFSQLKHITQKGD